MNGRQPVTYRNDKYGFTLKLPAWWRSFFVVRHYRTDRDAEAEIQFLFKYKGKVLEPVLTLFVYRMTLKEWADQGYEDSPLRLIAESGGRIFAYITPEELPYQFVDKKTGDYDYKRYGRAIRLIKRMVNRDVPRIIRTMRFSRAALARRSVPLLSRQVRRCGCRTGRNGGR